MSQVNNDFIHPEILEIQNQKILHYLNNIKNAIIPIEPHGKNKTYKKYEKYNSLSEQYCDDLILEGSLHKGQPRFGTEYLYNVLDKRDNISLPQENYDIVFKNQNELSYSLSCFNNALLCFYPPKGFIGWHNNANAGGYNILFTWSSTGDGYFAYRNEKNQTIKIQDKKGWSAKAMYFAWDTEVDRKKFYHCAYTDCKRISIGLRYNNNQMFWEEAKKDIAYE